MEEGRKKYAELHLHSTDLFDSMNKPEAVCSRMKELGAEGFALTQHGMLSGIEPMRQAAKNAGLKFVPGIETYYGNQGDIMTKKHLLLLSVDDQGYKAISMAVSDAQNDSGFSVMSEDIVRQYFGEGGLGHGHVIATSACVNGVIAAMLRANDSIDREIAKKEKAFQKRGLPNGLKAMRIVNETNEAMEKLQEELDTVAEQKKAAKKLAGTPMGKRQAALDAMKDGIQDAYEAEKARFDEDMAKINAAAEEVKVLADRQKALKNQLTKMAKQIREQEANVSAATAHSEMIEALKRKKRTPEELRSDAVEETKKFVSIFGEGFFYMEVQNHGIPMEEDIYPVLADVARELHVPIVATNDVHLVDNTEDERLRRQIMRSMRFGTNWEDESVGDDQLYIKTDAEMREWLGKILPEDVVEEGMANIKVIFDRCDVKFETGSHYPKFPSENGMTANEMLEEEISKGIAWRFPEGMDEAHKKRLEHEVPIIENMGYADYHLIVKDFLEYGRELSAVPPEKIAEAPFTIEELKQWKVENGYTWNGGLLIGPGRGSAVGSLVCYLLGITNLDPLKYDLLFERFLNPERISMPDIDSDIGKRTRPKVIEYVQHKYGENAVCGILTQTAQAPKGCVRIAAKYYGMMSRKDEDIPNDEKARTYLPLGDEIAKKIPNDVGTAFRTKYTLPSPYEVKAEHTIPEKLYNDIERHAAGGADITPQEVAVYIQDAIKKIRKTGDTAKEATLHEVLQVAYAGNATALTIIHWAGIMEGVVTAYGAHAAGIVISDDHDVKEHLPLRWNKKLNEFTTQCDMVTVEEKGCLKMDFLGLKTLDIITDTSRAIWKNHGKEIEILSIPLDDPEIYTEIFCKGRTNSVFQFESAGMKQMLKRFRPNRFEDLIILVSMFRPGPLQFIDNVINVKHGKEAEYLTDELIPILGKTYGSIVYQEQVMEIFQKLAGYTLGGADQVRRYMSKKKMDKLEHERQAFIFGDESRNIPGCKAIGITEEAATALFDQMTEFAKYAFNKSHAAAYAYLSYVTGWLKYYYPAEFLAAAMNWAEKTQNKDPIPGLMEEAKSFGVEVLPPNVNYSGKDFTVRDGKIIFGLGGVHAVGAGGLEVMRERQDNGKYTSLTDFFLRCDVKPNAAENLAYAGAFDDFTKNRAGLFEMIRPFKDASKKAKKALEKYRAIELVYNNADELDTEEKVISAQTDAGYTAVIRKPAKPEKLKKRLDDAKSAYDESMSELMSIQLPTTNADHEFILEKEHELLGAYVSGHPMDGYSDPQEHDNLADISADTTDLFVLVSEVTPRRTKKDGKAMASLTIEDRTGGMNVVCFPKAYEKCKKYLKKGAVLHLSGRAKEEETDQVDENGVAITRMNFTVENVKPCQKRKNAFILHVSSYARFHLSEEAEFVEKYAAENGHVLLIHDRAMNRMREMEYSVSDEAVEYGGIREAG